MDSNVPTKSQLRSCTNKARDESDDDVNVEVNQNDDDDDDVDDLRVTIILHAILCILSLHHNRRPNPAICLFQSLIILCQIKLSR